MYIVNNFLIKSSGNPRFIPEKPVALCCADAFSTAHSAQRTAHSAQRTAHSAQRTA
ncbi:MAG: hypothetical protein LBS12_00655 [Prevotellaceae bacterium]|nr:hypothetical protein [Prevotellaceae bacterium]